LPLNIKKNKTLSDYALRVLKVDIFMSISLINLIDFDRVDLDSKQHTFPVKVLDYVPIISTVSGIARSAFGLLQIATAPVQDVVSFVNYCFNPAQNLNMNNEANRLSLRGKANMIRGSMAMYPIIGNISVYLLDHNCEKGWELRGAISLQWII